MSSENNFAALRYCKIGDEVTQALLVGRTDAEQKYILALPFTEANVGSWAEFQIGAVDTGGARVQLRCRMTTIASTGGLRKAPTKKWMEGVITKFPVENPKVLLTEAAEAYTGRDALEESVLVPPAEEDMEVDAGLPRPHSQPATFGPVGRPGPAPPETPVRARVGQNPFEGLPGFGVGAAHRPVPLDPEDAPAPAEAFLSLEPSAIAHQASSAEEELPPATQQLISEIARVKRDSQTLQAQMSRNGNEVAGLKSEMQQVGGILSQIQAQQAATENQMSEMLALLKAQRPGAPQASTGRPLDSSGPGALRAPAAKRPATLNELDGEEEDFTGLLLPTLTGVRSKKAVHFEEPQQEAQTPPYKTDDNAMAEFLREQTKFFQRLGGYGSASSSSSSKDNPTDILLGDNKNGGEMTLPGTESYENYCRRVSAEPELVANTWWEAIRAECNVQEGEAFSAQKYGEATLAEAWKGHATLQRFWMMLSSIWLSGHRGAYKEQHAKTVQMLKSLAKCTRQKGQWAGAWELTFLPELNDSRGGLALAEEAALSRHLREKAAVAKALEEAMKKQGGDKA